MTFEHDEFEPKSKQQLKREATAAQELGTRVVNLSATHFDALIAKVDLPDKLRDALIQCRAIKAHEGRRRQLQFIGKLMREIDSGPIAQVLAEYDRGARASATKLHDIERWRDRLLREREVALTDFIAAYPQADAAQVRRLVSNAHKEQAQNEAPRAARMLFKLLREWMQGGSE